MSSRKLQQVGGRSRRSFLKNVPAAVGAAIAAPAMISAETLATEAQAAGTTGITAETLRVAQQIAGVELPESERTLATSLVVQNRANIEAIRNVPLPSETEPAFSYRPPRPKMSRATARRAVPASTSTAARLSKPASIESVAFEPLHVLAERLRTRQITSTELTSMYLDRLKKHDASLFCVVTLTEDLARAQAAEADREIRAGRYRGVLHGVPYGIKDLFAAKGIPTTWGAKPYEKQVFDYDSTAVTRLREAGAVLLGKLSTGELAVGDLWFRARTRNPWNTERGASGSSAGPASAASAGLVGFAVGTETNGSIISPASTCGVVGLRPTYGRVSRFGCMTLRWTLDKVGVIARSVTDTALVLDVLHGPDGRDETVADLPFHWTGTRSVKGLRIGYIEREFAAAGAGAGEADAARAARTAMTSALDVYRKAGATLVPVTMPTLPVAAIYAMLNAEAGAMFDELVRSGAINDLADKTANGRANQLRAARFIPAVDYIRAQRVRTLLVQQMNAVFDTVDVFLAPSTSGVNSACNVTGHPAMTVPAGVVEGLPVGLLITGPLYREEKVLQVAAAFEAATDWHTKHPANYDVQ